MCVLPPAEKVMAPFASSMRIAEVVAAFCRVTYEPYLIFNRSISVSTLVAIANGGYMGSDKITVFIMRFLIPGGFFIIL